MTQIIDQNERGRIQSNMAAAELIAEANRSHEEFIASGRSLGTSIIASANAARRTGLFLLTLKERTKQGDWLNLFASAKGVAKLAPVLTFEYTTGNRYMAIARALPDEITEVPDAIRSLKDLMVAIGAQPESSRCEQINRGDMGPYNKAERELGQFFAIINKQDEIEPVENWPADRREYWKGKLEPAVKLHQRLAIAEKL